jgi:hypothetical protein
MVDCIFKNNWTDEVLTAFLVICQRHRQRRKTGTDRPGLFYDVFDTHFVLNSPKRYDILKILIKYVIKQPGPVVAGPVRSRPVCAGGGTGTRKKLNGI